MPELPEVQTIVNDLNAAVICGAYVSDVAVYWRRSIAGISSRALRASLMGQRIVRITRRGKFIVIDLAASVSVLIHLRMSGRIHLVAHNVPRDVHEHVIISLDDGRQLRLHDTRKFARVSMDESVLSKLGVEPLEADFTCAVLQKIINSPRRMIKPLLLDQQLIAGLGNIYVDEALYRARIHPEQIASLLTPAEVKRLHAAIVSVLRKGIARRGTSLGKGEANFYSLGHLPGRNQASLRVYRRTNLPCRRCKTPIERIIVAQRGTHYCPKCQKNS